MTTSENPTKRRRTRRPSLSKLLRAMGREPAAIEQRADGSLRLVFCEAVPADPAAVSLDQELIEWESRREAHY